MEDKFPQLSAETPVASAVSLLQYAQALVIEKDGLVSGIVTNSDIGRVFDIRKS
jgi:predicted transcriptional regulator